MKVNYIWAILIALSFFGCDDNTKSLGLEMLPEDDEIEIIPKTYDITTRSVLSNAVYARTDTAYLGRYKDDLFGTYSASFLTQLNCLDSIKFPEVHDPEKKEGIMAGDTTHLTELVFTYGEFFGDSIAPMHLNVYLLNKQLSDTHYTDIDPNDFYDANDEKSLIGQTSFSAADLGVSDSIKNSDNYAPSIRVPLPKEFGERILRLNRENPEYFYDNKAFQENVLKGLYVECDEGEGTIMYIDRVQLRVVFNGYELDSLGVAKKDTNDIDIIKKYNITFVGTKEVIQRNKLGSSPEQLIERVAEKKHTFIKSPAGIFTEVKLPLQEILTDDEVKNDTIHSVKVKFQAHLNEKSQDYIMKRPRTLVMIRTDKVKEFFEKNELVDNITSYYTNITRDGEYIFNNISRLVTTIASEKEKAREEAKKEAKDSWNEKEWEEKWLKDNPNWDKVTLIPAVVKSNEGKMLYVRHNLKPEYARLKGGDIEAGGNIIKLDAIFNSFKKSPFE